MAKASEQMEKALKVSECVPEIGTELHRERLLSKLLDEAVVDGDPQTILLFKGLVRAAGEEDDGEAGTLGECATSGEATAWLQQNWKKGSMLADQICHNVTPAPGLGGSKPKAVSIDTQPQGAWRAAPPRIRPQVQHTHRHNSPRRGARRHQGAPGCPHLQRPPQGHQLQKAARYRAGPTES